MNQVPDVSPKAVLLILLMHTRQGDRGGPGQDAAPTGICEYWVRGQFGRDSGGLPYSAKVPDIECKIWVLGLGWTGRDCYNHRCT